MLDAEERSVSFLSIAAFCCVFGSLLAYFFSEGCELGWGMASPVFWSKWRSHHVIFSELFQNYWRMQTSRCATSCTASCVPLTECAFVGRKNSGLPQSSGSSGKVHSHSAHAWIISENLIVRTDRCPEGG